MSTKTPGYVTASTCTPLMAKQGLGEGAKTFARQIMLERSGLVSPEDIAEAGIDTPATEWGRFYELEAIDTYEDQEFVTVSYTGENQKLVKHKEKWLSCHPDGFVGKDGLVEVKCPASLLGKENHLWNVLYPDLFREKHYNQVQFQLMMTKRKWCDLVSYDPRYEGESKLSIVRLEPDEEWQEKFMERYDEFEGMVQELLAIIN